MRKATMITAAIAALLLAGCGGKEEAKPKPTTTTTTTTTTTLPPDKFAQQEYFKIVSESNPKSDAIKAKYPDNMSADQIRRFCLEFQVATQEFVDKVRAVSWPEQYQAAANDLIAKNGIEIGVLSQCAQTKGGLTNFRSVVGDLEDATEGANNAASAFRALVGLPVARN